MTLLAPLVFALSGCAPAWHYREALVDPHDSAEYAVVRRARGAAIAVGPIRSESDGMSDSEAVAEALRRAGGFERAVVVLVPDPREATLTGTTQRRCSVNVSSTRSNNLVGVAVLSGLLASAWTVGAINTEGFAGSQRPIRWLIALGGGSALVLGINIALLASAASSNATTFVDCTVTARLRVTRDGRTLWSHDYHDRVRVRAASTDLSDVQMSSIFLRIASTFGRDWGGAP